MITIDYKDRRPIYEQIMGNIEDLAARNLLAPNEQLPSVRQLATELSINPNTIQRAYAELEKAGVIYSSRGKGNFVADNSAGLRAGKIEALFAQMKALAKSAMELGATKEQIVNLICKLESDRNGGESDD